MRQTTQGSHSTPSLLSLRNLLFTIKVRIFTPKCAYETTLQHPDLLFDRFFRDR